MRARAVAVIVAVGCAAGGCASVAGQASSQPSGSPSPTATQAAPSTTTITVTPSTTRSFTTAPASPVTTRAPTPTPTPAPAPTATTQDPAAVVSAFYAAVNAQDYATAWKLGGDNLGFTYGDFAAGFAGTAHDTLTINGEQGNTVEIHLEALQSDGSTKVYDGSYIVSNGQIVEGRLTQTNTVAPSPTSSTAPPQGTVVTDPHGGYYHKGEYCADNEAGDTTSDGSGGYLICVFDSGRMRWE